MRSKLWSNRGIRLKVFTLCIAIALLPILAVNTLWSMSAHDQLRQGAKKSQEILLDESAERINDFFATKTNSLVRYATDLQIVVTDRELTEFSLLQYAKHDADILQISLVDSAGNEQVVVNDTELAKNSGDASVNADFMATMNSTDKLAIGEVTYDQRKPHASIIVPLQPAVASQEHTDPSMNGALIIDVSLQKLFDTVLTAPLGKEGYTYIVDSEGKLIAHPDPAFFKYQADLSKVAQVAEFLNRPESSTINVTTISEKDVKVMSGYKPIDRTGWAIITEEPEVSLYDPVQHVYRVILWVFIACSLAAIFLSYYFSQTLTRPIKSLVAGASRLGEGKLDTTIPIQSHDEIGVLAQHFNTMADNLKRLISNLKAESTKLNVVLNSVGEGVIAVDADNRIIVANDSAAALAGIKPADLSGKQLDQAFALTLNNQPLTLDLDSSKTYKEVIFTSPNRRLHYLDIFTSTIEDDPDGIKSIITMRDQTDERDLEMMKHDFVSMAAHELRTPITAIRGYLDLLAVDKTSELSDNSKRSIEHARSSTEDLVGLINNLLNVSKIEGNTLDMAYGKVNWTSLLKSSLENHKFSAAEKDITLNYEGPEEKVLLIADEIAIKEVVNNLIANAIHYTEKGGSVTVGVHPEQKQIVTYVKDTGIGVPASAIQRLFTKFFRVKGGMASGSGGTGLGLFISKSIVELHKGRIWVESEEGKGTTFTFTLPAYDEVQYEAIMAKQSEGVNKRRGWITKNTAR